MPRIIRSYDDLPVREYLAFLKNYNRLSDCSWFWRQEHEHRDRYENWELELLRNQKGGVIHIERDGMAYTTLSRGTFTASQTRLAAHRPHGAGCEERQGAPHRSRRGLGRGVSRL